MGGEDDMREKEEKEGIRKWAENDGMSERGGKE